MTVQRSSRSPLSCRPAAPHRRRTALLLFAVTGLLTIAEADATQEQEQRIDALVEMSVEELLELEVETVVGASKHLQEVGWAPSSVTIVTAEEIRTYGYRTLDEVLTSAPGVYVTYDRNYSYLGVRGFNRPGDYNTRILLLVDGQRLNDGVFDATVAGTDAVLDVDLIDRVEVVRGPSSSLYGSNAFLAVVNVVTRTGAAVGGGEIAVEGGSLSTGRARLTWGRRLDSGAEVLVSGSAYDRGGGDLYYPEFDHPTTHLGVAAGIDDDRFESIFTSASHRGWSFQAGAVSREKTIPTGSYGTVFNDPRTATIDDQAFLTLGYRHDFENRLEMAARLGYNRYDYQGDYVFDYAEDGGEPDLVVNQDQGGAEWWSAELTLSRPFRRHRLTFGLELRDNLRQEQRNFDLEVYLDDRRSSEVPAVYFQGEFRLRDDLVLSAGLRHDRYDTFGGTTNPRLGLIYRPAAGSAWKLLYGQAFRAPNAFELYYSDGDVTQKRNPGLEPETIDTLELVWEKSLRQNLRASVSAYLYEVDDLIDLTVDPDDELLVFANAGRVKAEGIELGLEGRFRPGVELDASLALQSTEDRATGAELTSSPGELAKLRLALPLWGERLRLAAETHYTGERRTLAGATLGSFAVTHLTLRAPDVVPGLELAASLYNLFDRNFSHPGSAEHLQDAIGQDGRAFRLRAVYRF